MANVGSLFVVLGLQASDYQRGLAKATKDAEKSMRTIKKEFGTLENEFKRGTMAIGAFGFAVFAAEKKILDIAGSMQQLKISLDTVTKGRGEEWFNKLNNFALELPVSLESVINSYRKMRAMGLEPNIAQMQTLVDTSSALGGDAGTLDGITLALGQIVTKGKLMSQEVRQLAERGIPAYEILRKELGITGAELEGTARKSINGAIAVDALFRGMEKAFGGQSARMVNTYAGQIQLIKNQFADTARIAGEVAFPQVIAQLKEINQYLKDNKTEMAAFMGGAINETAKGIQAIIQHRDMVKTAFEIMFGAWILNKIVKIGISLKNVASAIKAIITVAGTGMFLNIIRGGVAIWTIRAVYEVAKPPDMKKAPLTAQFFDMKQYIPAPKPQYQNPLIGESQELINKLLPFKPPAFDIEADYKANIKSAQETATAIIEITTEQQKQILDAQREYEKTKLDLIKDEGRKRLAEIGLWYKEEQDKAKDNATALAIIDKTRGVKLDLYDEWWKDQLDKAANDRKKRFDDIISTQWQQSRELDEATKSKIIDLSKTNRDMALRNTMTGFPLARAEEVNRFKDQQAELQKQFGKSPEYMKIMEGAAEEHKQRMIAIDNDQYIQMKENSLRFAEYWADNLTSVVQQAGNSFDNIVRLFDQMIKKMMIKAAVMGAINFVTGGAGGFAAGFMGALKVPGFASGGDVRANKPILVGEKGPEIITPKISATVIPTHKVIDFVMPKLAAPVIPELKAPKIAAPVMPELKVPKMAAPVIPELKAPKIAAPVINTPKIEIPKITNPEYPALSMPKIANTTNNNNTSTSTTDNSKWELHFHDSEGVKKMTGIPDEQFAEQFKRAVRDKKIDIRKLA